MVKNMICYNGMMVVHLFARDVLVMKKLEIEKTKSTLMISLLKVEY